MMILLYNVVTVVSGSNKANAINPMGSVRRNERKTHGANMEEQLRCWSPVINRIRGNHTISGIIPNS